MTGKKEFKGVISSNTKGDSFEMMRGNIKISSASLKNKIETLRFNPISITHESINNTNHLSIVNSDCIEGEAKGNFKITELGALFQSSFHTVYPFIPIKKSV